MDQEGSGVTKSETNPGIADTLPPPPVLAAAEDVPSSLEEVVRQLPGMDVDPKEDLVSFPIDEGCFLCVALPPEPPAAAESMTNAEFHYAHGFADGTSTAIRGMGHKFCERHHRIVRAALLQRGVNWGAPEPRGNGQRR